MTLSFAPERIEMWPLAKLQPYAKNAKTHGADQVAKIAASMAEFGWTVPCLVGDDGELIAGHGRVLAATQLGLTDAPVIVLGHLTDAQRRAYRIADNKLSLQCSSRSDVPFYLTTAGRYRQIGRGAEPSVPHLCEIRPFFHVPQSVSFVAVNAIKGAASNRDRSTSRITPSPTDRLGEPSRSSPAARQGVAWQSALTFRHQWIRISVCPI